MIRSFFIWILLLFGASFIAYTQNYGLNFGFGFNQFEGDFRQFKAIQDSIPFIGNGNSFSLGVGGFWNVPLFKRISLANAISIRYSSTILNANRDLSLFFDSNKVVDRYILSMDANFRLRSLRLSYSPSLRVQIFNSLYAFAGFSVGYELYYPKLVSYYEKSFTKGSSFVEIKQDLQTEGKHKVPLTATFDFGSCYILPENIAGLFRLGVAPYFSFGFTNVASDFVADVSSFGINIFIFPERIPSKKKPVEQIKFPPVEDLLPLPPKPPPIDTFARKLESDSISVDFVGVERFDGNEKYVPADVNWREIIYESEVPLLNMIFFEYTKSEIPARYHKIRSPAEFNFQSLMFKGIIEVYYDILNIIGYRLRQKPDSKIILVGCNSNLGEEFANLELSKQRASEVAKYLLEVWDIEPKRIKIEARNLPERPSNPNVPEGCNENQRVELFSNDDEILAPLVLVDTLREIHPQSIRFYARCNFGLDSLNLVVSIRFPDDTSEKLFKEYSKLISSIDSVDISLQNIIGNVSRKIPFFDIHLHFVSQTSSNKSQEKVISFPIKYLQVKKEYSSKEKIILPPFDFNSSLLKREQIEYLQNYRTILEKAKKITLVGHTDIIGSREFNYSLSKLRVESIAEYLKKVNYFRRFDSLDQIEASTGSILSKIYYGETNPIFENKLPEGRFYSRTVEIILDY